MSKEDEVNFDKTFSLPDPSISKSKQPLIKSFFRQEVPGWMKQLGKAGLNQEGKMVIKTKEALISVLAGYYVKEPLKFKMIANYDMIDDFLKLNSEKISVPRFGTWAPKVGWQIEAIKQMCKALHCSLAIGSWTFSESLEQANILQNVVLPGLFANMQALYAAVRQLRITAVPPGTPYKLKMELAEANMIPLWPTDIIQKIRSFFRAKRLRFAASRERGRNVSGTSRSRGRYSGRARGQFNRRQYSFRGRFYKGESRKKSEANLESRT